VKNFGLLIRKCEWYDPGSIMSVLSRWFKNKQTFDQVVGVRVTDDWIRFVEIIKDDEKKNGFLVGAHGLLRLPSGCVQSGRLKNHEQFSKVLTQTRIDFSQAAISLVVPDRFLFARHLLVPRHAGSSADKDIAATLTRFAANELAFPSSHARCEYEVLRAQKTFVDVYATFFGDRVLNAFKHSFVSRGAQHVNYITVGEALCTAHTKKDKAVLFVSFDWHNVSISVIANDRILYQKTIDFGVYHLVRRVQDVLDIDEASARRIITRHGVGDSHRDAEVKHILQTDLLRLTDEVYAAKQYVLARPYQARHQSVEIVETALSGEGILIDGLRESIAEVVGEPVVFTEVWDNFPHVKTVGAVPPMTQKDAMAFAPCIASAVELMKQEVTTIKLRPHRKVKEMRFV
jgi:Tfp pilus assembly PilM family ATPase